MTRPRVAVHKFSSCDGCQLAFLNMGDDLVTLAEKVEIVHFAEAGYTDPLAPADIAFIEGSIVTAHDQERIKAIRSVTGYLVSIGACATSGGIQALKNHVPDANAWSAAIYASPEYIDSLSVSSAIADYVKVDFELWGCPITSQQIIALVDALLRGVTPKDNTEKVCMSCKRDQNVCTLVTKGEPCLGPVTRAGCGALCPAFGRACFGCFGPSELPNAQALANRFAGLGLNQQRVQQCFSGIHSTQKAWRLISCSEVADDKTAH
jgi:sulfhydrogenase subunit delta